MTRMRTRTASGGQNLIVLVLALALVVGSVWLMRTYKNIAMRRIASWPGIMIARPSNPILSNRDGR